MKTMAGVAFGMTLFCLGAHASDASDAGSARPKYRIARSWTVNFNAPMCRDFLAYMNKQAELPLFDGAGRLRVQDGKFRSLQWETFDAGLVAEEALAAPPCPISQDFVRSDADVHRAPVKFDSAAERLWLYRVATVNGTLRYWVGDSSGKLDAKAPVICPTAYQGDWLLYRGAPLLVHQWVELVFSATERSKVFPSMLVNTCAVTRGEAKR